MLRALLTRLGLTSSAGEQLELGLGAPEAVAPGRPAVPAPAPAAPARSANAAAGVMAVASPAPDDAPAPPLAVDRASAEAFLARLRARGLTGITTLRLTRNRSTLVSFRAGTLRVHAGFTQAPEDVQRAIVMFVSGRGRARAAARALIVAHPLPREARAPRRRSPRLHPDDAAMAERLQREHARLNAERFGGTLRTIPVTVSRRMHTRLGHYAPGHDHPQGGEIAISRRHIRRHGWREALDTLLHEMVHQWQEESGHPLDHGPRFRRKAREVGTAPSARRVLR